MQLSMADMVLKNANLTNEVSVLRRLLDQYEVATSQDLLKLMHWFTDQIRATTPTVRERHSPEEQPASGPGYNHPDQKTAQNGKITNRKTEFCHVTMLHFRSAGRKSRVQFHIPFRAFSVSSPLLREGPSTTATTAN